jgi:glycosyltransferase involved in cell wall biosynthesis
MIQIGYDIAPLSLNSAGEYRYASSLLRALSRLDGIELTTMTLSRRRPRGIAQRVLYQGLAEALYYPLLVGARARRNGVDLLHYPRHLVPPTIGVHVPTVLTLHDVAPLTHPQYFSGLIARHQRLLTPAAARAATRVVTGSQASAAAIAASCGIARERIWVTPYGVEPRFKPVARDERLLERLGIHRPYVLCVGTLEPRKNLRGVIAAMGLVRSEHPDHALVVTGGRGWRTRELDAAIAASRADVIDTGYVSDDELVALYSAARCFAYPSFLEGFGFPVLEAMACGTPVVTSDGSSLPEVAGDAAVLVDPHRPEAIAAGISAILGSDERRGYLRSRGLERSTRFSWEATARATLDVYRDALAA